MRPLAISLFSLSFAALSGVGASAAQPLGGGFEGPIATGPAEVFPLSPATAAATVPAVPAAAPSLDLTAPAGAPAPAEGEAIETVTAAEAAFAEPDKVLDLSETVTLGSREVGAGRRAAVCCAPTPISTGLSASSSASP
jgi:hypothetical protein